MTKFVVVEDDRSIQEMIKKIIRHVSVKYDQDIDVVYFEKYTEELQKEIGIDCIPKVYIMDIELESSISGIDIAEKIRKNDWESEIIFVTNHDNMFETVHRKVLKVFDFIEKFQDMNNRLNQDIEKIFCRKIDTGRLKVKNKNVEQEIYLKNILYITRDKEERKAVVYTDKKGVILKINLTLSELLEKLDSRFIQTHKSCLANKERIIEKNYKKGYFKLDNGDIVDLLSKTFRDENA